jgi:predicted RNA-binding protein with PUA-like domain
MVRARNYRARNEMHVYSIGNMTCFMEEFSDTVFYIDGKSGQTEHMIPE